MDSVPRKQCSKCKQFKPETLEYFRKCETGKNGLRADCRQCNRSDNALYRNAHREEERVSDKRYRIENADKLREKDRIRAKYGRRGNYQINDKKYRETHKESKRVYDRVRRGRKRNAEGFHTKQDIEVLIRTSKGLCWWCGQKIKGTPHIDHRVPLVKGGSNWPHNLCVSCAKCNHTKNAKMPYEFNGRLL